MREGRAGGQGSGSPTVHEQPVPSEHPDADDAEGQAEGHDLSWGEPAAAAKGNPATAIHTVITHISSNLLLHSF